MKILHAAGNFPLAIDIWRPNFVSFDLQNKPILHIIENKSASFSVIFWWFKIFWDEQGKVRNSGKTTLINYCELSIWE